MNENQDFQKREYPHKLLDYLVTGFLVLLFLFPWVLFFLWGWVYNNVGFMLLGGIPILFIGLCMKYHKPLSIIAKACGKIFESAAEILLKTIFAAAFIAGFLAIAKSVGIIPVSIIIGSVIIAAAIISKKKT